MSSYDFKFSCDEMVSFIICILLIKLPHDYCLFFRFQIVSIHSNNCPVISYDFLPLQRFFALRSPCRLASNV